MSYIGQNQPIAVVQDLGTNDIQDGAITEPKLDVPGLQAAGLLPTAWCAFNGSTATILDGLNIASITRTSIGRYTVTFSTPMDNANYAVTYTHGNFTQFVQNKTTTGFLLGAGDASAAGTDNQWNSVIVVGGKT